MVLDLDLSLQLEAGISSEVRYIFFVSLRTEKLYKVDINNGCQNSVIKLGSVSSVWNCSVHFMIQIWLWKEIYKVFLR